MFLIVFMLTTVNFNFAGFMKDNAPKGHFTPFAI